MDLLGGLGMATRQLLKARGVRSEWLEVEGQRIHNYYLEGTGDGPPVVLLHGLGGNSNGFARTFFGLAKRFREVLAVDLPGHGFSPDYQGGPARLRGQLDVLRGYLKSRVREPAFLVGNSLGGAMAIMLAHESPELLCALGLIAPAGADLGRARLLETMRVFDMASPADAKVLTHKLFHKAPLPALWLAGDLFKFFSTAAVREIAADVRATEETITPAMLSGLRMPILVLWGQSEKLLPYEGVDFFKQHLPATARVHIVPGFGHMPQFERPTEVVSHLVGFADAARL